MTVVAALAFEFVDFSALASPVGCIATIAPSASVVVATTTAPKTSVHWKLPVALVAEES